MSLILILLSLISSVCQTERQEFSTACTIANTCFTNCKAGTNNGGAISVSDCSADITNCTFDECTGNRGGAISLGFNTVENIHGTIKFCTFTNCISTSYGGGLFVSQNGTIGATQQLTLENCEFSFCCASTGGAAYLQCKQAISIKNCNFSYCYGKSFAALLSIFSTLAEPTTTPVEIENCTFVYSPWIKLLGVQISSNQIQLKIGNCTFQLIGYSVNGSSLLTVNAKSIEITSNIDIYSNESGVILTPAQTENITFLPYDMPSDEVCDTVKNYQELITTGSSVTISRTCFVNCKTASQSTGGALYISKVNSSIEFSNFYDCSSSSHGGAIHVVLNTDTVYRLILTSCRFINCFSGGNGGAAYLQISNKVDGASILNCSFEGNRATAIGGGVYLDSSNNIEIINCTFKNNNAITDASSLYVKATFTSFLIADNIFEFTPSFISPSNVVFATNAQVTTASMELGNNYFKHIAEYSSWLHLKSSNVKIVMTGCLYTDSDKDAILVDSEIYDTIKLSFDCLDKEQCQCQGFPHIFPDSDGYYPQESRIERKENSPDSIFQLCKFLDFNYEGNGGAVFLEKCSASFKHCKFNNCTSTLGGAIYCYAVTDKTFFLNVINTSFTSCSAPEGGALYYKNTQKDKHALLFDDCKFILNTATNRGGALSLLARDNCKLTGCIFQGNSCANGASIYAETGNINGAINTIGFEIYNCNFEFTPAVGNVNIYIQANGPGIGLLHLGRNSFKKSGDVTNFSYLIVEGNYSNVDFSDCMCFDGDSKTYSIPAEYKDGIENLNPNCKDINTCAEVIPETTCTKTVADRLIAASESSIVNSCFSNMETTLSDGGGALFISKVNCTVTGSDFQRCKASTGGAVRVVVTGGSTLYLIKFQNCNFTENTADVVGGAVSMWNTQHMHSLQFDNCHFYKNSANFGGALYMESRGSLLLKDCNFASNSASYIGASLYLMCGWESSLTDHNPNVITGCTFSFKPSGFNIYNVYITGMAGGAEKNANLEIGGCYFSKSGALQPVHLYIAGNLLSVNFTSCICVKEGISTVVLSDKWINSAKIQSECDQSECKAEKLPDHLECKVRQNIQNVTAVGIVGTVFNQISTTSLNGGALYIYNIQTSVKDSSFISCSSTENGGAIYFRLSGQEADDKRCSFNVENTIFKGCSGLSGGALYTESSREKYIINISTTQFENNQASSNGGGIYIIARGNSFISGCKFTGNTALKGSSLFFYAGIDQSSLLTTIISSISENNFSCSGAQSSNVYFNAYKNGRVNFDGNFLTFTGTKASTFKHIIVLDGALDFASTECNCINGDANTVQYNQTLYPTLFITFSFNCNDFAQCKPASTETPVPTSAECPSYSKHIEVKSKVTIEKTCFYGIKDKSNGGAINAFKVSIYLNECRFSECQSDLHGGALYVYWSNDPYNMNLTKCVFTNCQAAKDGGAAYLYNTQGASKSNIIECEFTGNFASGKGGAFFYSPNTGSLLNSNKFIKNSCGGGIGLSIYNVNGYVYSGASILEGIQVEISNNIFRSEPKAGQVDLFIECLAGSNVEFKDNSFSFVGSNKPSGAKFINITSDSTANFVVSGEVCIDAADGGVEGLPEGSEITYNCKKAADDSTSSKPPNKPNTTAIIIGVVVAVVVVIIVIVVGIVIYKKKSADGKYLNDLNDDENNENANTASNL